MSRACRRAASSRSVRSSARTPPSAYGPQPAWRIGMNRDCGLFRRIPAGGAMRMTGPSHARGDLVRSLWGGTAPAMRAPRDVLGDTHYTLNLNDCGCDGENKTFAGRRQLVSFDVAASSHLAKPRRQQGPGYGSVLPRSYPPIARRSKPERLITWATWTLSKQISPARWSSAQPRVTASGDRPR
jgi:hypothetical protein